MTHLLARARRRRVHQDGTTLIEVLIAIALISVVVIALVNGLLTSTQADNSSNDQTLETAPVHSPTPPSKGGGGTSNNNNNSVDAGQQQQQSKDAGNQAVGNCTTAPPNHKCGVAPQCGCGPTGTCDVMATA